MNGFLLWARLVARTSDLKISRGHLEDYVKYCTKEYAAREARLFFRIQPIMFLICLR